MNRWVRYLLLSLSWIGSAMLGATVGLYHQKSVKTTETIRAERIEVVDETGRPRITLAANGKAASVEIMTSAGKPEMQFEVSKEQRTDTSRAIDEVPSLELGLDEFAPAVGVYASPNNRGIITFSNAQKTGKAMLGYFGTGDVEGVDDGMWGLSVSGRMGERRLDRVQGITSLDGKDTGLVWPVYSEELRHSKQ